MLAACFFVVDGRRILRLHRNDEAAVAPEGSDDATKTATDASNTDGSEKEVSEEKETNEEENESEATSDVSKKPIGPCILPKTVPGSGSHYTVPEGCGDGSTENKEGNDENEEKDAGDAKEEGDEESKDAKEGDDEKEAEDGGEASEAGAKASEAGAESTGETAAKR